MLARQGCAQPIWRKVVARMREKPEEKRHPGTEPRRHHTL
jgi:hypothetical protein